MKRLQTGLSGPLHFKKQDSLRVLAGCNQKLSFFSCFQHLSVCLSSGSFYTHSVAVPSIAGPDFVCCPPVDHPQDEAGMAFTFSCSQGHMGTHFPGPVSIQEIKPFLEPISSSTR